MAVITLGITRGRRSLPEALTVRTLENGDGEAGVARQESAVAAIISCIPGDILGIYLAWTSAFVPATLYAKWVTFGAFYALTPIVYFIGILIAHQAAVRTAKDQKTDLPTFPANSLVFRDLLLAVIAFPAWVWSLPQGPFVESFPVTAGKGAAAILLVTATILGYVKKLWP